MEPGKAAVLAAKLKANCDAVRALYGERLDRHVADAVDVLRKARRDGENDLGCAMRLCKEMRSLGHSTEHEEILLIGVAVGEFTVAGGRDRTA